MKQIALTFSYTDLKEQHRLVRDQQSDHNSIRIHRAISWLNDWDKLNDVDSMFIRLWVSFNAAYANSFDGEQSERTQLKNFLTQIVNLDSNKVIHKILFSKFSGSIRTLIDNKFAFEPFWTAMRTHDSSDKWKDQFTFHKQNALKVMMGNDTATLMAIIFDRIYTVRNQLIHGGATFGGSVNREQLYDACQLLADLVPTIIHIMIENPDVDFGEIAYPVVK